MNVLQPAEPEPNAHGRHAPPQKIKMRKGKLNAPHPHTPPQGGAIDQLATLDGHTMLRSRVFHANNDLALKSAGFRPVCTSVVLAPAEPLSLTGANVR